jgi:hypothetical protein
MGVSPDARVAHRAYRPGMPASREQPGAPAVHARLDAARRIGVATAGTAAATSAVVVLALLLFYAVEVQRPEPHVFGPISDIGTVAWDLLAVPLVLGLGAALFRAGALGAVVSVGTAVLSGAGAAGSALLVVGVLPFGPSTALSVVVILAQCGWLLLVGRRLAGAGGFARTVGRLGVGIALVQAAAAVLFAISLLLGWGSPLQVVVMLVAIVPGAVGWAAWPVWFALLAVLLRSRAAPWDAS